MYKYISYYFLFEEQCKSFFSMIFNYIKLGKEVNFSSFMTCQVLSVHSLLCMCLLQCCYHYSIFDENRTTIPRRFEQFHFIAFWVRKLVYSHGFCYFYPENYWLASLIKMTYSTPYFSLSIFSFHFCRCSWIPKGKLWVCLPQRWLSRPGDARHSNASMLFEGSLAILRITFMHL